MLLKDFGTSVCLLYLQLASYNIEVEETFYQSVQSAEVTISQIVCLG